MQDKSLLIILLIAIIASILILNINQTEERPLSSYCNGTLEQLRVESPKLFLEAYDEAKSNNSTHIVVSCGGIRDIPTCISLKTDLLRNANCMGEFLKTSDISEKEIERLRRIVTLY
ncbi:hypothetical protein CMI42_04915 [Candidatus Pacearchaeota archaeon]|jgi:hypothetical protein|nr:hypothetical protein [Candidatus Pacearchaeota archaeon]|tara:strand:- start:2600 stop:2950 length:351 start_codon:yes stop_codon:yes gene_type:complete